MILLFVGPSLHGSTVALPPGIERRPPARCGDMLRALASGPSAIALVDGLLEVTPTVWHKEILKTMRSVPVFGAASLGALRAAELHPFGMIGVGRVFEAYASGRIERDDAVLVQHGPAELGHVPVTTALVDMEAAIDSAPIGGDLKALLWRSARRLGRKDRTWHNLFDRIRTELPPPLVRHLIGLLDTSASVKRQDVERLVERLVEILAGSGASSPTIRGGYASTTFERQLKAGLRGRSDRPQAG